MIEDALLEKLLDALEAQIAVLKVQTAAVRQRLATLRMAMTRDPVGEDLPARCADIAASYCALRNADAQEDLSGFGVEAWMCRGCGHREERPVISTEGSS